MNWLVVCIKSRIVKYSLKWADERKSGLGKTRNGSESVVCSRKAFVLGFPAAENVILIGKDN